MQKKIICLILIVLVILGININVLAFDLKTKILTDNNDNNIQISLQLSDLDENPEGINAVSGKIVYNPDIFESVSLTGTNNWSALYNDEKGNENEGKFILITTSGNVTVDTDVAEVVLKLKQNVNNVITQIKIEQIETSYKSEKITAEDRIINLEINDNNFKIIENINNTNDKVGNYNLYAIIAAVVIIVILVIIIIKYKEKRTNEK